jgi:hypothetical protein
MENIYQYMLTEENQTFAREENTRVSNHYLSLGKGMRAVIVFQYLEEKKKD